jgi:transcriptional regulator with XRE-family HTH domain
MPEYGKVKGRMKELGLDYIETAKAVGVGVNTLSDKLNGKRSFKLEEAAALAELLHLEPDELIVYFFPAYVAKRN